MINVSKDLLWFYADRLFKSVFNILILYLCHKYLKSSDYYNFVVLLSLHYVFYAISTVGLDSKFYSLIKKNKVNNFVFYNYIKNRLFLSFICIFVMCVYVIIFLKEIDTYLLVLFCCLVFIRSFDVFEYTLIGCGEKILYSKIGLSVSLPSLIIKTYVIINLGVYWFVFINFIELIVFYFVMYFFIKNNNLLSKEESLEKLKLEDLFWLLLSSFGNISVSRFDQLTIALFFNEVIIASYLTIVRLFEPLLTFFQVLATYMISSGDIKHNIIKLLVKYHGVGLPIVVLYASIIWVSSSYLDLGVNEEYVLLYLYVGCVYFLNSSRIISGKILIYLDKSKALFIRFLLAFFVLFLGYLISDFNSYNDYFLTMILSLLILSFYSYYIVFRYSR